MRKLALIAITLFVAAPAALADECRTNVFQPTFVRHNSVAPRVWYVEPNGSFTLMASPDQAQATCRARGVRQLIGGRSCLQRNWGDFGCGCNIAPSPNATCARFQNYLRTISSTGPVLGPGMMNNINIPGGDIANFLSNDPAVCRSACQNNSNCVAWTWVRPGIQAASGRCWLKNSVPSQVSSTCCVSAIERRTQTGTMPSPSDDPFCRDLYARGDAANRAGNAARDRGNIAGARASYQQALSLFRQGAADRRCTRFRADFANAATIVERNLQRVAAGTPPTPQPGAGYLGCFRDQGDPAGTRGRDLNGYMTGSEAMSPALCVQTCAARGFAFAGVQYGRYCFCGNSYGRSGRATNCDMRCAGSAGQICGGGWANSVYRAR